MFNVSKVNLRWTGSNVNFLDSSNDVNDIIDVIIDIIIIIRTKNNEAELLVLGMTQ